MDCFVAAFLLLGFWVGLVLCVRVCLCMCAFCNCRAGESVKTPSKAVSDYTMGLVSHISAMYKAVIKPPRNGQGVQQADGRQFLAEVLL